jgi:oxygen-dependent protoporphyrinogen oxidase
MTVPACPRVVVVGGGVSGLTAAFALVRSRPDVDVTLLEARPDVGGNIRTECVDGFVIDAGPDSFVRTKPDAVELCRELGLEGELIPTRDEARHVFVAQDGKLELLPGGMALAVPTRLSPLLQTPLLSLGGKLRMLLEPLAGAAPPPEDESIADFFARRVGKEGAARLAGPLLGGIYAGDVSTLSMRATFPQLVELEAKHGSLLRGLLAAERSRAPGAPAEAESPGVMDILRWLRRSGEAQAASPFLSLRGGMSDLVGALRRSLPEGTVHTGAEVTSLSREGGVLWRVEAASGESFVADAVILATPAHVAARLAPSPELRAELGGIPYLSTATVFFAVDRAKVASSLAGFGFIVPEGEAEILAATWVSSKWDGRAPEGAALVRAFVGGARDPERVERSTDEELVALARRELERFMGPLGEPLFTRVHRYVKSNPQPIVGHGARVDRIRALARAFPGLHFAGAAYDGVGIPDCVRQARTAARAVLAELAERGR